MPYSLKAVVWVLGMGAVTQVTALVLVSYDAPRLGVMFSFIGGCVAVGLIHDLQRPKSATPTVTLFVPLHDTVVGYEAMRKCFAAAQMPTLAPGVEINIGSRDGSRDIVRIEDDPPLVDLATGNTTYWCSHIHNDGDSPAHAPEFIPVYYFRQGWKMEKQPVCSAPAGTH